MPWELAWQEALYGPAGFYRHHAPASHFSTSAEGVPGAGPLLAEALVALARRHGCTAVVDVGCGRGELLAHLRVLAPDLHLTGVDVVEPPRGLDVDRWLPSPGGATLPAALDGLTDTLVLAHEWLDVVPCPVAKRDSDKDGGWRALAVEPSGTEHVGPPLVGAELAWAERWLGPQVRRAEIGLSRDRALVDLLGRVVSGVVVAVDYGHLADDRPPSGTLTAYRDGREVPPVPDGSCDLTAHVAIDSLAGAVLDTPPQRRPDHGGPTGSTVPTSPTVPPRAVPHVLRQRDVLLDLLPDPHPATPVPHELARRQPTAYLRALARRSALATLTARGGLGDFWWVVAVVGEDVAA